MNLRSDLVRRILASLESQIDDWITFMIGLLIIRGKHCSGGIGRTEEAGGLSVCKGDTEGW